MSKILTVLVVASLLATTTAEVSTTTKKKTSTGKKKITCTYTLKLGKSSNIKFKF